MSVPAGIVLSSDYDAGYVVASYIVATLGSGTSLIVMKYRKSSSGWLSHAYLVGAAIALGAVGIWSMHFIGQTALTIYDPTTHTHIPMGYNPGIVVASLVIAIITIIAGFAVVEQGDKRSLIRVAVASLAGTGGICSMHYLGMTSMVMQADIHYNIGIVAASVIVGFVAVFAALLIFFYFSDKWQNNPWIFIGTAMVMGIAVCAVHYTGMAAATYTTTNNIPNLSGLPDNNTVFIITLVLSLGTCGLLCIGVAYMYYRMLTQLSQRQLIIALQESRTKLTQSNNKLIETTKKLNAHNLIINELYKIIDDISINRPWQNLENPFILPNDLYTNRELKKTLLFASAKVCRTEHPALRQYKSQHNTNTCNSEVVSLNEGDTISGLKSPKSHNSKSSRDVFGLQKPLIVAPLSPTAVTSAAATAAGATTTGVISLSSPTTIITYSPTLLAILSHPMTLELFKDEVERSQSTENVLFLSIIIRYKLIISLSDRTQLAIHIINQFILDNSPLEININSILRHNIINKFRDNNNYPILELFDSAVNEIRLLVMTNHWKHFILTNTYKRCSLILQRNVEIITEFETRYNIKNDIMSHNTIHNGDDTQRQGVPSMFAPETVDELEENGLLNNNNNNATENLIQLTSRREAIENSFIIPNGVDGAHSSRD